MPTYIILREQPDGSLLYGGVQQDINHIPDPPSGTIYSEIGDDRFAEFVTRPLVPGKTYRATPGLDAAKAGDLRQGRRQVSRLADLDWFDIPPPPED